MYLAGVKVGFKPLGNKRTFLNPILAIVGKRFTRPTYTCITHGDFNRNNILVDNAGQSWLIDFFRTGRGHILRDIAELDSVIRLELLGTEEATLEERLCMEEHLCRIDRFSQIEELEGSFSTENHALAKAYETAVHLRRLARHLWLDPINEIEIS